MQLSLSKAGCDASDPANSAGCCTSDVKAVLVSLSEDVASSVASVRSVPNVAPQVNLLPGAVNITAAFGAGGLWQVTLVVAGQVDSSQVCAASGCAYRVYGGTSITSSSACCGTSALSWA
jgi:hypothetical protein